MKQNKDHISVVLDTPCRGRGGRVVKELKTQIYPLPGHKIKVPRESIKELLELYRKGYGISNQDLKRLAPDVYSGDRDD